MRELTIAEMSIVGGGISVGDEINGGTVVAAGGAYTAAQAAAAGAYLGVGVGLVAIGAGTFLITDALLNNGDLLDQFQEWLNRPEEDEDGGE